MTVDAFVAKYNGGYWDYDGYYGAQCVDLFEFYNRDVVGAPTIYADYAYQLYANFPAPAPTYYDRLGPSATPVKGDVAVWGSSLPGSQGAGHVAIVLGVVNSTTLQVIQQNAPVGAPTGVGNISTAYLLGYLRPKSLPGGSPGGYETSFQANTGSMWVQGDLGTADTGQGLFSASSPGIAVLGSAGYETTFQANTGNLFVYGSAASYDTQQGMMAGTSPSIAASPSGGFKVAFQANNGSLYTFVPGSAANLQLGMAPGTSPAIAALAGGGYAIAFQANTGDLWITGDAGTVDTHQGMAVGTSPSIAASRSGGYKVAFQANTGNMFTYSSAGGAADLQVGMAPGTSPGIAALAGSGYEMAFQANTGNLWAVGDAGGVDTGQGMMPGTSPAIAGGTSGGYRVAFQANTGNLYYYTAYVGAANIQLGLAADTSPCIASALGGGCAPGAHLIHNDASSVVTGIPRVGSTLSATSGSWSPTGVSPAYQWLANGAPIGGATGAAYALSPADLGKQISVRTTGTRLGYVPTAVDSPAVGPVGAPAYQPLMPARLLDTRSGIGAPTGPVPAGGQVDLQVNGRGGVPADAAAVVLNVTVVYPATAGYVTVYPSGASRPTASNLNFAAGQTMPNQVIAKVGTGGKVSLYTASTTYLLADVAGYYPAGSLYTGITPVRLIDTRSGLGTTMARIPAGGTVTIPIAGTHGVPTNATAAVINVTPIRPSTAGAITAYPAGTPTPVATTVSYRAGQIIAGMTIAKLGTGGKITLRSTAATDLVVDLAGWIPAGSDTTAMAPVRVLTTYVIPGGTSYQVRVTGTAGVPTTAKAVLVTLTAAKPSGVGYLTAYPKGASRPTASNLNYSPGGSISNSAIVKVGAGGYIALFASVSTPTTVDISGYWTP